MLSFGEQVNTIIILTLGPIAGVSKMLIVVLVIV